jgi:predicted membrane protein
MDPQAINPECGNPEPDRNGRNTPGMVISLVLVAAGVVLLLDQMGIAQLSYLFRFWPSGVILLGLSIAIQSDVGSRIWGGALTLGGIILLLNNLGYVHVEFWAIWWPLAMIAGGVSLLWAVITGKPVSMGRMGNRWRAHNWRAQQRRGHLHGAPFFTPGYWDQSSVMNETAIFGGGQRRYTGEFEGGRLAAIFGGYRIDLRESQMKGDEVYLHIAVVFGGANIFIPRDWNLVMRGVPIFGGYSDRTQHPPTGPGTKTLYIVGAAIFGGVEVRN